MVASDVVAERGRLFDARAGAGADVNLELAGVHGGEEILAEPGRKQANRANGEDQEENQEDRGVIHAEGEQAQVSAAEALKARLEGELKADERIAAGAFPVQPLRRRAP